MFSVIVMILVASLSEVYTEPPPKVLVLSFSGIHPDEINEKNTPYLFKLSQGGTGPLQMRSVFPTEAFATHFSLATGVCSNVHGVLGPTMFLGSEFKESVTNDEDMFKSSPNIIPIWTENQNPNERRYSGMMMWPGAEFTYGSKKPHYIQTYDEKMSWMDRAKTILEWLTNDNEPANLVMAYFDHNLFGYDKTKHDDKVKILYQNVETTIKRIYEGLKNILSDIHILIISDHGMIGVDHEHVLPIERFTQLAEDKDSFKWIFTRANIYTRCDDEVNCFILRNKLVEVDGQMVSQAIFESGEYRSWWHMLNGPNVNNRTLVLNAMPGYAFFRSDEIGEIYKQVGEKNFVTYESGYDNKDKRMNGFFIGIGKSFKTLPTVQSKNFKLTHVYPLLKKILELKNPASEVQPDIRLRSCIEELLVDEKPNYEKENESDIDDEPMWNGESHERKQYNRIHDGYKEVHNGEEEGEPNKSKDQYKEKLLKKENNGEEEKKEEGVAEESQNEGNDDVNSQNEKNH